MRVKWSRLVLCAFLFILCTLIPTIHKLSEFKTCFFIPLLSNIQSKTSLQIFWGSISVKDNKRIKHCAIERPAKVFTMKERITIWPSADSLGYPVAWNTQKNLWHDLQENFVCHPSLSLTLNNPVPMNKNPPTLKIVQNLHKRFHSQAICKLHDHREYGRPQSPHVTSCSKRIRHQIHLKSRNRWRLLAPVRLRSVTNRSKQVNLAQSSQKNLIVLLNSSTAKARWCSN